MYQRGFLAITKYPTRCLRAVLSQGPFVLNFNEKKNALLFFLISRFSFFFPKKTIEMLSVAGV